MLKAAVIGVGSIGQNHARIYNELDDVELVWIHDVDADAVSTICNRYGVTAVDDYVTALDDQRPDLISICVPTSLHHTVAVDVLQRGIHTLIEKPIASTVAEGREIIQLAADNNALLTVGHIERFNPAILMLKERLDEGDIGDVFRIQARRMGPFPSRIRDAGVGIDLGTHDIDMMRFVLGSEVDHVYAQIAHVISDDHEDLLDGILGFANGVQGVLNVSRLTPTKVRELTLTGSRGMFRVNYITQELYFYDNATGRNTWDSMGVLKGVNEGNMTRIAIPRREPLKNELMHFVECVRTNEAPLVSGADGLAALQIALKLIESGKTQTGLLVPQEQPSPTRH